MASKDVKLPYRYLGNSGLKVSALCLGAMTFGQREVGNVHNEHQHVDKMLYIYMGVASPELQY